MKQSAHPLVPHFQLSYRLVGTALCLGDRLFSTLKRGRQYIQNFSARDSEGTRLASQIQTFYGEDYFVNPGAHTKPCGRFRGNPRCRKRFSDLN